MVGAMMGDSTHAAVYRLIFDPVGELLEETHRCEARVFLHAFGNTAEQLEDEYGPYDAASHFIALADSDDEVVASCRVIAPSPLGLKTIHDIAGAPWFVDGARAMRAAGADLATAWDVTTIAVRHDIDVTPLASAALFHGMLLAARANSVRSIVMMLDDHVRRLLELAGFVARPIPGTAPAPYLGSAATVPLVGDVPTMVDNQRRLNPDAYRLMTLGVGLSGISVPPLSEWRVRTPSLVRYLDRGLSRTA
jgi:hypothetical protein